MSPNPARAEGGEDYDCLNPTSRLNCLSPSIGPYGTLAIGVLKDWCSAFEFLCPEGRGGSAARNDQVSLFRAVGPNELEDIIKTRGFRAKIGAYEGKLFATSFKDAEWWGRQLKGEGNFHIVEVKVPRFFADQLFHSTMDGRETVFVAGKQLDVLYRLGKIRVRR